MKKSIITSGLLGGIVMFVWIIISTSLIPLSGNMPQPIPNAEEIQTLLTEKVPESGIYWLPGPVDEVGGLYPDYENEPIFYIFYAGVTPNSWGASTIVEILSILLAPIVAAWLLSMASGKILAKYSRRVLFVTVLGVLFAVYGDLFSQKPLDLILLSSINNIITWTFVGLVLAWRIKQKKVNA